MVYLLFSPMTNPSAPLSKVELPGGGRDSLTITPPSTTFISEVCLPCHIGQVHRIENYLLGCDQICFATGLCFSEHRTASCQDPFYNLNIYASILKQIERKNMFCSGKSHILGFSAFLQGHKKLWRNLFSVVSPQEIKCI